MIEHIKTKIALNKKTDLVCRLSILTLFYYAHKYVMVILEMDISFESV